MCYTENKDVSKMELLQLRYFCDAALTQNFSRTAEKYRVPPSNISQCIKRLETELGTPLFRRSANRVTLSEAGRAFYDDVRSALQLIDNAARTAADPAQAGTIRIGMCIDRRVIMQAIEKFRRKHEQVHFITQYDWPQGDTALDLVVTDSERHSAAYTSEQICRERILLAARKGLLPADELPSADTLRNKPFVTMNHGSNLCTLTYRICREMGFEPHLALQSEDSFYVRKCIELGLGIGFVPSVSWHGQFSPEVELHSIGDYSRDIVIHRRRLTMPWYVDAFYATLAAEFRAETDI